ncbi:MAG: hypothetical protein FI718_08520 [SAR202 cluster bacterium]|nr:hypothetical protein [SAR202 cluster bacterium]|tara:strand:+ start:3096 stop:3347 length:252 start_codon:yes stop_codon:yes gene_type:complete
MSKFILASLVLISVSVILVFVLPFVAKFLFRKLGLFILRRLVSSVYASMDQYRNQYEEEDVIYGKYKVVEDEKEKGVLGEGKK